MPPRWPSIKKIALFAFLLMALVAVLGFLLVPWLKFDPGAPRFVAAKAGFVPGPWERIYYKSWTANPFEGGKMWITVGSKKDNHIFLFDIEKRKVLGELFNAQPDFMNHDQSKVLCKQRAPDVAVPIPLIKKKIMKWLSRFHWFKVRASHEGEDHESFWVLDLIRSSATRLGQLYQLKGTTTFFQPSPKFRYAFNKPTGSIMLPEIYVCDIEARSFRRDRVDGYPVGWWDNERILVQNRNTGLALYNVVTLETSVFLTLAQIRTFYHDAGLPNDPDTDAPPDPGAMTLFFMWNGRENDFYFSDVKKRSSSEESFLAKIERPDGTLKLLNPHFKFEWPDSFDATGNYYLYNGRNFGEANNGVYVRDWKSRQTRELVPPDPETKQRSMPGFYRGEVIYVRSNALWRIKLDGSNNRRLFPPPDGAP